MPTLQNTGHLKNSPTEKKYSHRRYGLFLILFIKAAIMPAEEWSTHWLFGRFPERKAVSPAFNLEVHFLTIPSWLIIAGDKKTAQTSSVWLQHSLLFYVYFFFFKGGNTLCFFPVGWLYFLMKHSHPLLPCFGNEGSGEGGLVVINNQHN